MNLLDPDLKRLLAWSRRAARPQPEETPLGFVERVLASRDPAPAPALLLELQEAAWAFTGVSLAVILSGVLLLMSQGRAPEPAAGITVTLSVLASQLPP